MERRWQTRSSPNQPRAIQPNPITDIPNMERTPHELVKPSLSQTVKGTDAAREGLNAHYPRSATYANKPARGKINFPGLVGSAAPNHRKVLERPRRPKKDSLTLPNGRPHIYENWARESRRVIHTFLHPTTYCGRFFHIPYHSVNINLFNYLAQGIVQHIYHYNHSVVVHTDHTRFYIPRSRTTY